uniref:Uncharacterized protein n=1 Tax=Rhizophora mucronata TaxID=61149 RepID=A0A2P2PEF9_RHIMU
MDPNCGFVKRMKNFLQILRHRYPYI